MHVRFAMDVSFSSDDTKTAFVSRLDAVRKQLTPAGAQRLDNYNLLSLFQLAEGRSISTATRSRSRSEWTLRDRLQVWMVVTLRDR